MAEEVFIPKLGQTVEEVTILQWYVKDGASVKAGQELLEVETDKAVFDVEAADNGIIHIGPFKVGDVIPVLTVVAVIGDVDDNYEALNQKEQVKPISEAKEKKTESNDQEASKQDSKEFGERTFVSPRARKFARERNIDLRQVKPTGGGGVRIREADVQKLISTMPKISPLAKRMAVETNLDLTQINPSGPNGFITLADVENALARRSGKSDGENNLPLPTLRVREKVPLKGMRGVIARRMSESSRNTARVTMFMDVDATGLVAARENLRLRVEKEWGFPPGFNDLLAEICASALRQFPYMNARLNRETIEIVDEINIGIAVDTEKGLYVPVIRDVDQKELHEISGEFRLRVEEVRRGKIHPENLSGGTFTITNLGMYEVEGFTPIINQPETAILGVGKITPKPVVMDEEVAIRQMMTLSLAFDHRLIDGAPAARFFQSIKQKIEILNQEDFIWDYPGLVSDTSVE